jgi:hypothetical protein
MKIAFLSIFQLAIIGTCLSQANTAPHIVLQHSENNMGIGSDAVLFIDAKCDTVKRVPLGNSEIYENDSILNSTIMNQELLSRNKKYLGLVFCKQTKHFTRNIDEVIKRQYEVKIFSIDGKLLWTKYYPTQMEILCISDEGNYILVSVHSPMDSDSTGFGIQSAILVLNNKGKLIMQVPPEGYFYYNKIIISPNGKYMSIYPYAGGTGFFNNEQKLSGCIKKNLYVRSLSDNGEATIMERDGEKIFYTLNLKDFLRKE